MPEQIIVEKDVRSTLWISVSFSDDLRKRLDEHMNKKCDHNMDLARMIRFYSYYPMDGHYLLVEQKNMEPHYIPKKPLGIAHDEDEAVGRLEQFAMDYAGELAGTIKHNTGITPEIIKKILCLKSMEELYAAPECSWKKFK